MPSQGFSRTVVEADGTQNTYRFNPILGMTLSFLVGFFSSLLGIGGGIIHVPALVYLLQFSRPHCYGHIAFHSGQYGPGRNLDAYPDRDFFPRCASNDLPGYRGNGGCPGRGPSFKPDQGDLDYKNPGRGFRAGGG